MHMTATKKHNRSQNREQNYDERETTEGEKL